MTEITPAVVENCLSLLNSFSLVSPDQGKHTHQWCVCCSPFYFLHLGVGGKRPGISLSGRASVTYGDSAVTVADGGYLTNIFYLPTHTVTTNTHSSLMLGDDVD